MSGNEFDSVIRNRFDDWHVPLQEDTWDLLRQELQEPMPTPKKVINKKWLGWAAAFIIFSAAWASFLYRYLNNETQQLAEQTAHINLGKTISNSANVVPAVPANQPMSALSTNFPVANAYSKYLNKPYTAPGNNGVIIATNNITGESIIQSQSNTIIIAPTQQQTVIAKNETEPTVKEKMPTTNITIMNLDGASAFDGSNFKTGPRKFQVGVVGALGYGGVTSNGYSVGVNTTNRINDKLFFDNTIAFGSSQELYNLNRFQNNTGAAFTASKGSSSIQENLNLKGNIYFITVAPSIGVNITQNFSLSGGGDVQRIVKNDVVTPNGYYTAFASDNNGTMAVTQNVQWKDWDAGITAKAAMKLNKRLDVGVQYRKGLVNLLSDQQGMDLKRSYGTISLQYRIIGDTK